MDRVERAVVDPQVTKDAEELVRHAQKELSLLEAVVGCRFTTHASKPGFTEMIHISALHLH